MNENILGPQPRPTEAEMLWVELTVCVVSSPLNNSDSAEVGEP